MNFLVDYLGWTCRDDVLPDHTFNWTLTEDFFNSLGATLLHISSLEFSVSQPKQHYT